MALEISDKDEVKSAECISCAECVHACPVPDTLQFTTPAGRRGGKRRISSALVILGTLAIFVTVLGVTTWAKKFAWKADTGLEKQVERLLWGPQRIGEDNTLLDVVQIFQIHPAYFAQELGVETEEEFYMSLKELNIDPRSVEEIVNRLYEEAGQDPRALFGGSGGGCSGDH